MAKKKDVYRAIKTTVEIPENGLSEKKLRVRFADGHTEKIVRMDGKYIYTFRTQYRILSPSIAEIFEEAQTKIEPTKEVSAIDPDDGILCPVEETVHQEGET